MGQNNDTILIALQGKKLIENAVWCCTEKLDCVHADSDCNDLGNFLLQGSISSTEKENQNSIYFINSMGGLGKIKSK